MVYCWVVIAFGVKELTAHSCFSASCYLPQLLDGLDVTDSGTPQPQAFANDGPSDHQDLPSQVSESRRGSVAQHEQAAVYAPHPHGHGHHVYQEKQQEGYGAPGTYMPQEQNGYAPHDGHAVYPHPPTAGQDTYPVAPQDVYSPMDKGGSGMMGHCEPPPVIPQSHTSELAFALRPSGSMVSRDFGKACGRVC